MGHTTKTTFTSTTDWVAWSSLTSVFSGTVALTATPGWYTVTLDTPFVYNGTDNLLVAVDKNTGSYISSAYDFYAFSTVGNMSLERHADVTNIVPTRTSFLLHAFA